MAHQITLTDDEYAALAAAAARTGKSVDELAHAAIAAQYTPPSDSQPPQKRAMSDEEFLQYLLRKGLITHIPERHPHAPEEDEELERLARSVRPGKKMISDMVIEDRGPR